MIYLASESQLLLIERLRAELPGTHPLLPVAATDAEASNEIDRLLMLKTRLVEEAA